MSESEVEPNRPGKGPPPQISPKETPATAVKPSEKPVNNDLASVKVQPVTVTKVEPTQGDLKIQDDGDVVTIQESKDGNEKMPTTSGADEQSQSSKADPTNSKIVSQRRMNGIMRIYGNGTGGKTRMKESLYGNRLTRSIGGEGSDITIDYNSDAHMPVPMPQRRLPQVKRTQGYSQHYYKQGAETPSNISLSKEHINIPTDMRSSGPRIRKQDSQMGARSTYNSVQFDKGVTSSMLGVNFKLTNLKYDEQKIQNRIALLQQEEQKILKKITETRSRAEKIMTVKQMNEESYVQKLRAKQERNSQLLRQQAQNRMRKEDQANRAAQVANMIYVVKKQECGIVKQMKEQGKVERENLIVEELAHKMVKVQETRDVIHRNRQRQAIDRNLKMNASKAQFNHKLLGVEHEATVKEMNISKLESIEAELLGRIKNTQNLQLKVFNQLEEAMYQQQFGVSKRIQDRRMSNFQQITERSQEEIQQQYNTIDFPAAQGAIPSLQSNHKGMAMQAATPDNLDMETGGTSNQKQRYK